MCRDASRCRMSSRGLEAVQPGHHHVEQDDGEVVLEDQLERLAPRRALAPARSPGARGMLRSARRFSGVVVDQQDGATLRGGAAPWRLSPPSQGASASSPADSRLESTGFGTKSVQPASRHFSRSPGIALAVSAMIGSVAIRPHRADRAGRLVAVHPGIMMSISTRSTSGCSFERLDALLRRARPRRRCIRQRSSRLVTAKRFRASSSTTRTFLLLEAARRLLRDRRLGGSACAAHVDRRRRALLGTSRSRPASAVERQVERERAADARRARRRRSRRRAGARARG